ncbi:DUF6364 family protein [Bacteroidota bacterium]
MSYKLTLSIDKSLSEQAKVYARSQGRSLSDLVESYFRVISSEQREQQLSISPKMKSLRGVLKVDEDYDYKEELGKALSKKYLK